MIQFATPTVEGGQIRQVFELVGRAVADEANARLDALAQQIARRTEATAPRDTGFMAEHVHPLAGEVWLDEDGETRLVGWRQQDFIDEGHQFPYYVVQEFGSRNQAAQPSLGPAAESILADAGAVMTQGFAQRITVRVPGLA